jgi:hypothetical protein
MRLEDDERSRIRSRVQDICVRLSDHCGKVKALLNGFEVSQINNPVFRLDQPFGPTKSSLTRYALMNMVETYRSLRADVREISGIGYTDFEILFPNLDINFETYYSVSISLLNMIYQMQHMRIYCLRLFKS